MSTIKSGHKPGRKPVDLVAASGYRTPQNCVWEAVRALKQFNVVSLERWLKKRGYTDINSHTLQSYIKRLLNGHYIEIASITTLQGIAKTYSYQLINDVGIQAPRLTKEGDPSTQGLGRENLWRSMKVLDAFNYIELAQTATTTTVVVKPSTAQDYIKHLYRAGYLQRVSEACCSGGLAHYRLIAGKSTGPHPPMVQRIKQVFDPNLNKVVWPLVQEVD